MVRQDLEAGQGLALLDPQGDLVERVLAQVPERSERLTLSTSTCLIAHIL